MKNFFTKNIFGYGLFLFWLSIVIDVSKNSDVSVLFKIVFWAGVLVIIIFYLINVLDLNGDDKK